MTSRKLKTVAKRFIKRTKDDAGVDTKWARAIVNSEQVGEIEIAPMEVVNKEEEVAAGIAHGCNERKIFQSEVTRFLLIEFNSIKIRPSKRLLHKKNWDDLIRSSNKMLVGLSNRLTLEDVKGHKMTGKRSHSVNVLLHTALSSRVMKFVDKGDLEMGIVEAPEGDINQQEINKLMMSIGALDGNVNMIDADGCDSLEAGGAEMEVDRVH